jgi:hypothetical protein
VKSASGAGARERVRSEMGLQLRNSSGGSADRCRDSIITLGEGPCGLLTTIGEGALPKLSGWGVAWKQGAIGAGDYSVEAAGKEGGLQAETGNRGQPWVGGTNKHTLEGSWGGLLGQAGSGERVGRKASGAVRHYDSKISGRLVIASTWRYLWEVPLPVRAPATT